MKSQACGAKCLIVRQKVGGVGMGWAKPIKGLWKEKDVCLEGRREGKTEGGEMVPHGFIWE